jgi:hypothetical protein
MLCLALLLPLIALAGGRLDLRAQNVANDGQYVGNAAPVNTAPRGVVTPALPKGPSGGTDFVGRIDTVGGTMYDWQINGNSDKFIEVDPANGVHVTWMFSAQGQGSGYTDRNMRYNYYDLSAGAWNFIDPTNFMNSGVNTFTIRSGYGMLDVDPVTHVAYLCCHQAPTSNFCATVAKDAAPGAGIFSECVGEPATDLYQWPSMCLTSSEQIHVALCDNATTHGIFESDVNPWCTWSTPVAFQDTAPIPGFPTYIATGSKTSTKAVISWEYENTSGPATGYYRVTTDDGASWGEAVPIPTPPAYTPGSDSLPSFTISGIYPFLDDGDNLHIVATVAWTTASLPGSYYISSAEIWHYYEPTGAWNMVARWGEDTTSYVNNGYAVGYNCIFCGRPTLCQSGPGELECVWEGFDSLNGESTTGFLRSEIFGNRSTDNGLSWGQTVMLTDVDSTSKRFPSIATHTWHDTCFVRYEDDLIAGYGIDPYDQGAATNNPIIVQRFWKDVLPPGIEAVAEGKTPTPASLATSVHPNPFRGNTVISYSLPRAGNVSVTVYDVTGRPVKTLVNGHANPGNFTATWDGKAANGAPAAAGVYFYTLATNNSKITRKLTLLQ